MNTLSVYIDCGGKDVEHSALMRAEAKAAGVHYHHGSFDAELSHSMPLLRLLAPTVAGRTDFAAQVVRVLRVGEGAATYWEARARQKLAEIIESHPDADTFARIHAHLRNDSDKDTQGLVDSIGEFAELRQLNVSAFESFPQEVRDYEFDFSKWLREGNHCAYVKAARMHSAVPLLLLSLAEATRVHNSNPDNERCRVVVVIDEGHRVIPYAPDLFARLIALARAFFLRLVVVQQGTSQLEAAGGEQLVQQFADSAITTLFGTADGTHRVYGLEHEVQEQQVHPDTGIVSIVRRPLLNPALFTWLQSARAARGVCLVRTPTRTDRLYTMVRSPFATDFETFKRLKKRGWPKEGELKGALPAVPVSVFGKREDDHDQGEAGDSKPPPKDDFYRKRSQRKKRRKQTA